MDMPLESLNLSGFDRVRVSQSLLFCPINSTRSCFIFREDENFKQAEDSHEVRPKDAAFQDLVRQTFSF